MDSHSELKSDPLYNPNRFPRAFEDALLMVVRKNHLNPVRLNLEEPCSVDGAIQTLDGKVLFYYDAEYSHVESLFDENGKFHYYTVDVPIEKARFFEQYKKAVYVRGNLENVLVLRGTTIVKALKNRKVVTKNCKHGSRKVVVAPRDFISVHTYSNLLKNLRVGPLESWLRMVKALFALDLYLV